MTTITDARQSIRTRIESGNIVDRNSAAVALRWQNEEADSAGQIALPDTPTPFVYTEFLTRRGKLAGFGGGRGSNLYRYTATVRAFAFVPRGDGLDQAESIAEQVAARLRSYRDSNVSCFAATVHPGGDGELLTPPGMKSEVGNYFWAVAEVDLHFDQVG